MHEEVRRLVNNFSEIFKTIHQRSYHRMEDKFIYPGQPKLLILIKDNEGITQKELAEKNNVTPATITGMLNKLEANHFVYRVPDKADKRVMRVYLTPDGHYFAEQSKSYMIRMTQKLFDGFTDDELHSLISLTEKMKANLRNLDK